MLQIVPLKTCLAKCIRVVWEIKVCFINVTPGLAISAIWNPNNCSLISSATNGYIKVTLFVALQNTDWLSQDTIRLSCRMRWSRLKIRWRNLSTALKAMPSMVRYGRHCFSLGTIAQKDIPLIRLTRSASDWDTEDDLLSTLTCSNKQSNILVNLFTHYLLVGRDCRQSL